MDKEILLKTENLNVDFKMKDGLPFVKKKFVRAVTDVSVEIFRGETFGLVGESGCGKSTFANATLGLLRPSSGKVIFCGKDVSSLKGAKLKEERRRMQKIFQDPAASLNPRFSVLDIVTEPLLIRGGYNKEERRRLAIEMLEKVGLSEADLPRSASEFSGGQQQRIAIARSLIIRPEYLVCDEPVSALDVSVHAQILNLLVDLQREMGVTYLFISHNLAVVKKICSRMAIMYLGKVVEYGSTEKIFSNPLHPYTKALMSAVLDTDVTHKKERIILKGDVSSPVNPPAGCRFCKRCPVAKEDCEKVPCMLEEVETDHFVACRFINK
ncbi:MAG: ATP-binding cassette domain-containing protein [Clostridia bacterium]|nr:ATP-binding cassette domain-containing protein [Clostridia bacterium]